MKLISIETVAGVFPVSLLYRRDDGGNHRLSVTPDDDLSDLPDAAQTDIRAHWAGMDRAAWEALVRPLPEPVTAADIKGEAERRILALLPDWKQRNLNSRGVELVLALVGNRGWTPEEAAEAATIQAQWDRVKAIRARSDELARMLPGDFAANRNWPA